MDRSNCGVVLAIIVIVILIAALIWWAVASSRNPNPPTVPGNAFWNKAGASTGMTGSLTSLPALSHAKAHANKNGDLTTAQDVDDATKEMTTSWGTKTGYKQAADTLYANFVDGTAGDFSGLNLPADVKSKLQSLSSNLAKIQQTHGTSAAIGATTAASSAADSLSA